MNWFVSNENSPKEIARTCPNCGKICWDSDLYYSSTIKTGFGGSTLYGVCKTCKDTHDMQDIDYDYRTKKIVR